MGRVTHHMLVAIAAGVVLLISTAVLAEQKDPTMADPAVQRSDVRTSNLTGGFYGDKEDRDKADNWYYDFYETPSAGEAGEPEVAGPIDPQCRAELEKLCEGIEAGNGRIRRCFDANEGKLTPSCRTQVYARWSETTAIMGMAGMAPRKEGEPKSKIEAKNKIRPDAIKTSEKTVFVDAATPVHARSSHPQFQESALRRYYNDPWYYEERDASYTMTSRPAPDASPHSTQVVKGSVTRVKQVRNTTSGGQNTVVQIKPAKGDPKIVDLGPTLPLLNMALVPGDSIAVDGPTEQIGAYPVLMANHVKSGANAVTVARADTGVGQGRKEAVGRLDRVMEVPIRGTGQTNNVAAIKTDSGRMMLIDLGPTTAGILPAGIMAGDHVVASGPVATVGNYPVLFAERVSIADAAPVKIARPEGYPGASREAMEASQTLESPSTTQPTSTPQSR
jgi:hypothetical protein